MHALLNIALRAARDAAEALAHQFDRLDRIKVIDDTSSRFLTSADLDADKTVLYHLQKAHPDHCFSSRVSGDIEGENKNIVWLIDPLVGTNNLIRGVPGFAISVACQIDQKISHAVLIDPLLNEEFTASRGRGANLRESRLRVTDRLNLADGLISLNYPTNEDNLDHFLDYQRFLINAGASVRIGGCGVLDVAHTAAGRFDGGSGLNPGKQSMASAALILQESGGLISDPLGNPELTNSTAMVFGNPKCFKQLLQIEKSLKS
jgi:myo-inositol-1(or 4)-monophosphatase